MRISRVAILTLALLVAALSACMPQSERRRANALDYLYPDGKVQTAGAEVKLQLPLRVGIAFAPTSVQQYAAQDEFSEPQQREMLKKVAAAFRGIPDIGLVEILPTHNLVAKGGFENLQQIAGMYGVGVVALISYDQVQFDDQDFSSILYWTIIGAYFVPADRLETRTLLDAAVFDVDSRALLFTGSGSSIVKARTAAVNVSRDMRDGGIAGFDQATDDMIGNLKTTLDVFRENAKKGTVRGLGTPKVQIQQEGSEARAGGSGAGAVGFAELAGVALLALAAALAARARAGRVPVVTAAFVAFALLASFGPESAWLAETLVLDRAAFLGGEVWRAFSGHLVHGWPALAFFDLGAIAILGAWIEQRSRVELAVTIALAALLSSAAVIALRPDLSIYQGSSALASALFVVCAGDLLRTPHARVGVAIARIALVVFVGKLVLESTGLSAGRTFAGIDGVESVALAHATGALAGALVALRTRAPGQSPHAAPASNGRHPRPTNRSENEVPGRVGLLRPIPWTPFVSRNGKGSPAT